MKVTVHNILEAKVLIKESVSRGEVELYDGASFYTHKGEYLFHAETHGDEVRMFTEEQAMRAAGIKE